MVKYFCDRCGLLIREHDQRFSIKIEPPEYYSIYDFDPEKNRFEKQMHLCSVCVNKVLECIDELGRNDG